MSHKNAKQGVLAALGALISTGVFAESPANAVPVSFWGGSLSVFLIGILFFLLVFQFAFTRFRLRRVARALERFAEGDGGARCGVRGPDAVGALGMTLDRVLSVWREDRRQLSESEERLKVALQGCDIGVWDWRVSAGITYYSPRWKSLLGFAEDDTAIHGLPWLQRVHPDDLGMVTRLLEAHMGGQSNLFAAEHRLRHADGNYRWVQQSGVAIRDPGGEVVRMIGALTDITARREAEQALVSSKEAYRAVLEGVTQVIFRADPDGRLVMINAAWEELTGHPVAQSLGERLQDYLEEEDRLTFFRYLQEIKSNPEASLNCELRIRGADGWFRWFSAGVRTTRVEGKTVLAGVLADIEARKAAEAELARSNGIRDAILDLGPDGFVFVDPKGAVSFVNPAFVTMTGLPESACVGHELYLLERQLDERGDRRPVFVDEGTQSDGMFELKLPRKVVIRWQSRALPGEGARGHVIYLRDVTSESEVDQMKSDFLSTAAHELRTPMSSIFGFSEMLLSREFEPAMQKDLLTRIHRQTKNLINLVNELLDLSRIEARGGKNFKMSVQDVTPVLLNAIASQHFPEATHRLVMDWPKLQQKVSVDSDKLQQCIINVLSNAVKYSPAGGQVIVSYREKTANEQAFVGIAVTDEGIGMTPEQSARIFDRFYRANSHPGIQGTGLGMALVKEYMRFFAGEVEVQSEPGEGTTVILWLPVAREVQ